MNKVLMIVTLFGSIFLLARRLRSDSQPLLRNLFGVLVALDRFVSGRRSSGRGHCGEEPACCFHEEAAPLGAADTAEFPYSRKHSLQDQVVGCERLVRSPELELIRPRAGRKYELAAGENAAPTEHPRLLRGRKGMNTVVRYGDDRTLVLNERAVLDHHALVRDADKTGAATFHIEDGVDRL